MDKELSSAQDNWEIVQQEGPTNCSTLNQSKILSSENTSPNHWLELLKYIRSNLLLFEFHKTNLIRTKLIQISFKHHYTSHYLFLAFQVRSVIHLKVTSWTLFLNRININHHLNHWGNINSKSKLYALPQL